MNFTVSPIWNVIASIEGGEEGDRSVILGNHRDAWVFGAADPVSGTATLLELARGFGKMLSEGWRPRRNVILASWDAEEYGLIGSTEWVEQHSDVLREEAVAYVNVDVAVSGSTLHAESSPSLAGVIRQAAANIRSPTSDSTLYGDWLREQQVQLNSTAFIPAVGPLGSGSDFTPFLQHLGIPAIDMGFSGTSYTTPYGVYHSIYDSFTWMELFGDPGFKHHEAMAKLWGHVALLIADSSILPFDFGEYARELQRYYNGVQAMLKPESSVNLSSLQHSIYLFGEAASKVAMEIRSLRENSTQSLELRQLNDRLAKTEQKLLLEEGLPGRPWYKHVVDAP